MLPRSLFAEREIFVQAVELARLHLLEPFLSELLAHELQRLVGLTRTVLQVLSHLLFVANVGQASLLGG